MFEPSIAWLKMGRSPAGRWAEAGDSKRTLWINGFHGKKIHPIMKKGKKWRATF
jgi:hypothetical protein